MIEIKGLVITEKYGMFRLNDLWIVSGKSKSFHPKKFLETEDGKILIESGCETAFKKGRFGGVYSAKPLALAYSEWLSKELFVEFQGCLCKELGSKIKAVKGVSGKLVPVTTLCHKLAKRYHYARTPQQLNLVLAALGYQVEDKAFSKRFSGGHKRWSLTEAGKAYGCEIFTISCDKFIRWSPKILEKIL